MATFENDTYFAGAQEFRHRVRHLAELQFSSSCIDAVFGSDSSSLALGSGWGA